MAMLTEQEFKATLAAPMGPVPEQTPLPLGFWAYFESIDESDLKGFAFGAGVIAHAWRDPTKQFDHVRLACVDSDVFLVLVIDLQKNTVHGHHLLDLPTVYGLRS